jgi:hypothetical protein
MKTNTPPPRDLGPLWRDLSHVIAGLPVSPTPWPAADAPPPRGPPRDEQLPPDDGVEPSPAARWALVTALQLATAGATAALLTLMGLSPL